MVKGKSKPLNNSVSQSLNTTSAMPTPKDNSGSSNEYSESEESEESEDEDTDSESEDEEMLNKLRFKRKPKTVEVTFKYKAPLVKLVPEVSKKERAKEIMRKKYSFNSRQKQIKLEKESDTPGTVYSSQNPDSPLKEVQREEVSNGRFSKEELNKRHEDQIMKHKELMDRRKQY